MNSNDMFPTDHRDYLRLELTRRIKRRPHYSLRAFARDLDLSPSTLSDFLGNKFPLSALRVQNIAQKISLTSAHQEHWIDLIQAKFSKDKRKATLAKIRLQERFEKSGGKLSLLRFQTLTNWHYLCVYHLLQMHERFQKPEACAKALGVSVAQIRKAISTLTEIGLLEELSSGVLVAKEDFLLVSENTPSSHIRQYHGQFLQKAILALETQPMEIRENSTTLLTIRKSDLPLLKKEIQNFADQVLAKFASTNQASELFCLSTELFSLTPQGSASDEDL